MKRLVFALFAVSLAVCACAGPARHASSPDPPSPTRQAAPASPARPADPYAIPVVITPAYVDKVFAALNHVKGMATRVLAVRRAVTPEVTTVLRSIYNNPLFTEQVKIAGQSAQAPLPELRHPLGDVKTSVVQLISNSPKCIFARTTSEYAAVLVDPGAPAESEYYKLTPTQIGADPHHLNPTPWSMSFNAVFLKPTTIPDQCSV
jgi:hypothetical protein